MNYFLVHGVLNLFGFEKFIPEAFGMKEYGFFTLRKRRSSNRKVDLKFEILLQKSNPRRMFHPPPSDSGTIESWGV